MPLCIGCVVEGHGEVEAVPVLLRRIAAKYRPEAQIHVPSPLRIHKDRLLKTGELERAILLASKKTGRNGAILVVLDADGRCPKEISSEILSRIPAAVGHLPAAVVIAKQEFEAWFIAAAESLRGRRGLSDQLAPPDDPETIRGAKEWLARHRNPPSYAPTVDQPALASIFDIELARRRSPSFDKFCRETERLIRAAAGSDP